MLSWHAVHDPRLDPCVCRYQSNTSSEVLNTITNIQPKESGGGAGETRETIVYRLAQDMLEKLPPNYLPHEVRQHWN